MKKFNKITPAVFYITLVLFAVVLLTTHLSGGIYAKYTSTVEASSTARVAAYVFELTNADQTETVPVTYTANGDGIYKIEVSNTDGTRICEVSQTYTVTVENLTGNVNFTFTLYSDADCQNPIEGTPTGTLPAGVEETDYIYLKITLPENADHSLAYEIDLLNISVSAEQID